MNLLASGPFSLTHGYLDGEGRMNRGVGVESQTVH